MRKRRLAIVFCAAVVFSMLGCTKTVINPFAAMEQAVDDHYGYIAENPIRIGYYKETRANIRLSKSYIHSLRTAEGETLTVLERASVEDPKYDPSTGGFLGFHQRGAIPKGGILDLYTLVIESKKDTIQLYIDIYHKEPLKVPKGLYFDHPADTASTTQ